MEQGAVQYLSQHSPSLSTVYVSVFMSAMQREEMMARSRVRLSAITVEFVERRSGGQYLYCAIHRTFENIDNFSAGANGQQRAAPRFCLRCTPEERRRFDELANVVPTDEGRREGARLLKIRLADRRAAAPSSASPPRDPPAVATASV